MARAHEEQRIILELTEDEACVIFSLVDHLTDNLPIGSPADELYNIYSVLKDDAGQYNAYTREELGLPELDEDDE